MKRKLLKFILVFSQFSAFLQPFQMSAAAETYGDLNYTVSNGTVEIADCNQNAETVIIPNNIEGYPVASIGEAAFYECKALKSVTIPDSVKSISSAAFGECWDLTDINIPDKVTYIGGRAFDNCKSLSNITIPDGITAIEDSTFSGSGLKTITIPDSVKSIGYRAFWDCSELNSVTIGKGVTSIGAEVFSGCSVLARMTIPGSVGAISEKAFLFCDKLKNVDIQNGVTSIKRDAFGNCSALEQITIPDSVTSIGCAAFSGCESLKNITIPAGVETIEDSVFYGCIGLKEITLPRSVTSIGDLVFGGCSGLTDIKTDELNKYYSSLNGILYNKDKTKLINYPIGKNDTSFSIPNTVTVIGSAAFFGCPYLTNINIPDNVNDAEWGAFSDCTGLTRITIPNGVTHLLDTFSGCTNLTQVSIPKSIEYISDDAFKNCSSLKNVYYAGTKEDWAKIQIISTDDKSLSNAAIHYLGEQGQPVGVTGITLDIYSLSMKVGDTKTLKATIIPDNATNKNIKWGSSDEKVATVSNGIITAVSAGTATITAKTEDGERTASCVVEVSGSVIASGNCGENVTWTLDDAGTLTISGTGAMQPDEKLDNLLKEEWTRPDRLVKALKVNHGVTSIDTDTDFSWCRDLSNIYIPDTVESVNGLNEISTIKYYKDKSNWKNGALYVGNWLIAVDGAVSGKYYVSEGTVGIGSRAFYNSDTEREIIIPEGVKYIGEGAFSFAKIKSISIPSTVEKIETFGFTSDWNSLLERIDVSKDNMKYTSENGMLFNKDRTKLIKVYGNREGEKLVVPSSVKEIDQYAFAGNNMKRLVIPEGIKEIHHCFAGNCELLEDIYLPSTIKKVDESAFDTGVGSKFNLKNVYINMSESKWNELYSKDSESMIKYAQVHFNDGDSNIVKVSVQNENGTVCGDGSYVVGDNVTLTVKPDSGYDFAGWYIGGEQMSTDTTYSFTVNNNVDITAKFSKIRRSGGSLGGSVSRISTDKNTTPDRNNTENNQSQPKDGNREQSKTIRLKIGQLEADIFGEKRTNDVAPIIRNDRTMLPARFVAESLGAEVRWNSDKRLVTVTGKNEKNETVEILITINDKNAIVNGKTAELDSPAFIENDRTYTPIRFIAELLGANVEWNEESQTVTITTK